MLPQVVAFRSSDAGALGVDAALVPPNAWEAVGLDALRGKVAVGAAATASGTLVVDVDGAVVGWGGVGGGVPSPSPSPVAVPALAQLSIADVSAGAGHAVALVDDGSLVSWALGSAEVAPVSAIGNVLCVACGDDFTVAADGDGAVWVWGNNDHQQLGVAEAADSPCKVSLPSSDHVIAVACGAKHWAALTHTGQVVVCGDNGCGQLGLGSDAANAPPSLVPHAFEGSVVGVACGANHTVVWTDGGKVYAWGDNSSAQIPAHEGNQVSPVVVAIAPVRHVSAGGNRTTVVSLEGTVMGWGDDTPSATTLNLGHVQGVVAGPSAIAWTRTAPSHCVAFAGPGIGVAFAPRLADDAHQQAVALINAKDNANNNDDHNKDRLQEEMGLLSRYERRLAFSRARGEAARAGNAAMLQWTQGDGNDHPLSGTKAEYELVILGFKIGLSSEKKRPTAGAKAGLFASHNVPAGLKDAGFTLEDDEAPHPR